MDKTEEARRSNMASSNGVTKRRQRISENSRVQMGTVRDRPEKKERDPESLNRSKRRRSERYSHRNDRDEEDNTSDEDEDVHHYNHSKSISRHTTSFKVTNEMIGVSVPRKARSACIKRSYDCRTPSGSGGGDDRRRHPSSPGSYTFEVVSPSSSTVSVKQKKNVNGSKSRIPKPPRSSGANTIENDLEIEVAEVLSGLKKHHHTSKRQKYDSDNSFKSSEDKGSRSRIETEHPANVDKGVSEGPSQLENKRDESDSSTNLGIDLMVTPTMPSSPEMITLSDSIVKNEMTPEPVKQKVEKREWLSLDLERPSQPQHAKHVQQSSVLPLPMALGCWPNGIPLQGYVPVIEKEKPVDGSNGSSTSVQGSPFYASQPRPKRCATHFFIARNIQLHQHFLKTNHLSQPNKDSIYIKGGDLRPPATNPSLLGTSLTPTSNSEAQDKITANISAPKDKASESGHFASTRQKKHQPPPAYSTVPAQAFIFPTNHHLQQVIVPSKSPRPTRNQHVAIDSASGKFNHPSSSAIESSSSYFTVVPNNVYSFQLTSTIKGGSQGQVPPFFSGSFYSPQMFQPPQLLQKQSQAQRETKATNSSSSSSHKQPQVSVISLSSQANVQKHRQQTQKSEAKPAGDSSVSRGSHTQKGGTYGQIMTAPAQPQNFCMSFASGSPPANLNFSSNGYHFVSALPIVHQKNQQVISDSKIRSGGSCSSNAEDSKKTLLGKPPATMNGQTLVFDNPSRTLNFVSGTWPPPPLPPPGSVDHSLFNHQRQQQPGRSKPMTHSQADSVPATSSLTSCNSLNIKQQYQSQQQIRAHGQTQISFAAPLKSQTQEHQRRSGGSSSSSSSVTGSALHGKAASPKVSNNSKAMPLSPVRSSTENPASAASTTQNTSPVCGRNVPPIITSCPGQMSELKY